MKDNNPIVLQVGVKGLLKNSEGKYLLIKRSVKKYPDAAGRWEIPGGRIQLGTTLLGNLRREVREETGLEITDTPKLVTAQDILRIAGRQVVRLTYRANVTGEVKIDPEEVDDFKWVEKDELKEQEDLDMYLKQILKEEVFGI